MQAHGSLQNVSKAFAFTATIWLTACGGSGGSSISGSGSSGGGPAPVLAGTFTIFGASKHVVTSGSAGDNVFGAVDTVGNGFFADMGSTSPAPSIFAFATASSNGAVNGFFHAYAANGGNLGSGTTLVNGLISGTVATVSGNTQASLTYTASSFSNTATLVLDNPPQAKATLAAAAGTYSAPSNTPLSGISAIASGAWPNASAATYTVTLSGTGSIQVTSSAGCAFTGTATADSTYNTFALSLNAPAGCNGNSVTLNGLAIYLPRSGHASPLTGSALTNDALVLELDDSITSLSPQYALAMVATRTQ
ncbi:MAG: hypothetical protein P4L83_22155 [Nevskia sp.]|nr:hypothetical protein [Nevskia sp.]